MSIQNLMKFDPENGLENTTRFFTVPASEEQARADVMEPSYQLRDFINAVIIPAINNSISNYDFYNFIGKIGYYFHTVENDPRPGDITTYIKNSSDHSVFGKMLIEFNAPNPGNISETVIISSLGINTRKITEFDTPAPGQIKESVVNG